MSQLPPPPSPPPPGGAYPGGYGGGYSAKKTNGFAIASLVLGIIPCCNGILAIIFGFVAKNQIKQSGGTQGGDGMATAGIVLGIAWLVITAILYATGSIDVGTN
jgi:Domain of unknown function (DUF4190)